MDGTQCTRRCREGQEFCGSHLKNLSYGEINDGKVIMIKEKGKRGRKKKNINNNNLDFIETWIDMDLGVNFLIDRNNLIYKNNPEYPELVGMKVNGVFEILNHVPKIIFE